MAIEIYLKGSVTFVKVTDATGAVTSLQSSGKNRELRTTARGVIILPDDDSYMLNNFEIILSDLVDDFEATNPIELLEALSINNFFKEGGGGVSGEFIETTTANIAVGGFEVGDQTLKGMTLDEFAIKLLTTYLPPSLASFILDNDKSSLIIGEKATILGMDYGFNTDSENNVPTEIFLSGEGFNLTVGNNTTSYVLNTALELIKNTQQNSDFRLRFKDKNNASYYSSVKRITWYNQFLFGASNLVLDNSNFQSILDTFSVLKSTSKTVQRNCNADNQNTDNYTYAAYNATYGDLTNVILNGSSPVLGAFTKIGAFNFVNSVGLTVSKNVYRSNAKGAFTATDTLNFS